MAPHLITRTIIKKIFTLLVYPTSLLAIITIAFIYLLIRGKVKKWHKIVFIASFSLVFVLTSQPVSSLLISSLENNYQSLTDSATIANNQYIIVLGGGFTKGTNLPALSQLSSASLARLIEGMRLKQLNPSATLLFSGGNNHISSDTSTEADIYQFAYRTMSKDTSKQILSRLPHNTQFEATEVYKLIGNKPAILVTSAYHMPRAMYLFEKTGCNVTAAPCEFLVKEVNYIPDLPNSYSIKQFEMALHEFIGITAYKIKN